MPNSSMRQLGAVMPTAASLAGISMAQTMEVTPVSTASAATCEVVRSSKAAPVAVPASGTRRPAQPA